MTEDQNNQILALNTEKKDLSEKNINSQQENKGEFNQITIEVKNNSKEIQNSENRMNEKNQKETLPIIQLQLNEKDIQLPSETIEKLNLPPCQICQSKNFSVYIPESFDSNNSKQENPVQQPNNNDNNIELQNIKPEKNYFFPVIICQQNHQLCILCHQNLHLGSSCTEQVSHSKINIMFDIIKEVIPEEKKSVLDDIYNYILNKPDKKEKGCCSGPCFCYTFLFIFLLFLWTIASVILFNLGLCLLFVAYGLRLFCCFYHICISACCTTSVTEEDKGDYILRTTTVDVGRQREIEREAANNDECLSECAPLALAVSILLIPKVYKKIIELYDDWKNKF